MKPLTTAVEVGEAMIEAVKNNDKQRQLSVEESKLLIKLVMGGSDIKVNWEDPKMPFGAQVAYKRCKAFNVAFEDSVLVYFISLCDRPGTIVMYCALLKALEKRYGRAATLDEINVEIFPWRVPTEDALTEIWDAQKTNGKVQGSDNWLDHEAAWQ